MNWYNLEQGDLWELMDGPGKSRCSNVDASCVSLSTKMLTSSSFRDCVNTVVMVRI